MSSSPAANPQHEPTMEEILASIRKIISEDQPDAAKPAAPAQPALRAVPSEPKPAQAPAAAPQPAPEMDVLDLTEELPEEQTAEPADAAPAPADDIAFETVEPETPQSSLLHADPDDFISDSARSAVVRAFSGIDNTPVGRAPLQHGGGAIEAIFIQAVQGSFQPTLQNWVDEHRAEIMEAMKPLIRSWMDEHLPALIEAAVIKEIGRAAGTRKR
jgi:cell pole-organizing protein PopZ